MNIFLKRVVVVGTGTGIGKTHVTASLCRRVRDFGVRVAVWKPIASGLADDGGDGRTLAALLGVHYDPPLYGFQEPISPHLAAARTGVTIDLAAVRAGVIAREAGVDLIVVEGAGGLFSPFGKGITNADLALALAPCAVLLVAPDRLGVLHDVTTTMIAARSVGLAIDAVALSAPASPDTSTGTNAGELAALAITNVAVTFPRANFDADVSTEAAARVWPALGDRYRERMSAPR